MNPELDTTGEKKYPHLWVLIFLLVLYFLSNQDRMRFGYLSRHLFTGNIESKSIDKNVRVDDAFAVDIDVYNEILQGGKKYLPFLVLKLQTDKQFVWSELMRDITGVDIYQYAGNRKWINTDENPGRLWLKWWQENEYQYQGYGH